MTATMTISSPSVVSRNSGKKSAAQVIPPGAGRAYWAVGDHLTFKLGPEHTAGAFSVAEVRVAPGGGPPPHLHHREDEMFYLLEGTLQFIKGDELCLSIAAASIIAKVTRDRIMIRLHEHYPVYGFAQHKGYGTEAHLATLRLYGATPHHRRSFAPVRELFGLFP